MIFFEVYENVIVFEDVWHGWIRRADKAAGKYISVDSSFRAKWSHFLSKKPIVLFAGKCMFWDVSGSSWKHIMILTSNIIKPLFIGCFKTVRKAKICKKRGEKRKKIETSFYSWSALNVMVIRRRCSTVLCCHLRAMVVIWSGVKWFVIQQQQNKRCVCVFFSCVCVCVRVRACG